MILFKSHGLGNDYLVLASAPRPPSGDEIRRLCHRHRGVGADGLLVPVPTPRADYGLRIYNPDGSEAEKSGNGLRIFAHWLHHYREAPAHLTVWVGGERAACHVQGDRVRVEMGRARFRPAEIPLREEHAPPATGAGAPEDPPEAPPEDRPVPRLLPPLPHPQGAPDTFVAVGTGNPHCVLFVEAPLDDLPWRAWGQALERSPAFPNRTNVQFVRIRAPDHLEIRIWERGVGPTLASGSSACASAAAAVFVHGCESPVRVAMPGGPLHVEVRADATLVQEGPVRAVATIHPVPGAVDPSDSGIH